jgi:hypothetical protein
MTRAIIRPIITEPELPPPRIPAIATMSPPIEARRIVVLNAFLNMVSTM